MGKGFACPFEFFRQVRDWSIPSFHSFENIVFEDGVLNYRSRAGPSENTTAKESGNLSSASFRLRKELGHIKVNEKRKYALTTVSEISLPRNPLHAPQTNKEFLIQSN